MSHFTTLNTKYPCCGGAARIRAWNGVPKEVYSKTCRCGQKWDVERRLVKEVEGRRVDVLEWTALDKRWHAVVPSTP